MPTEEPYEYSFLGLLLCIFGIMACFVAPACIFIYILLYPESESCWVDPHKDVAMANPSRKSDVKEKNVALWYMYWAYSGLAFNLIMIACYVHALRIPCIRLDLTWLGQVRAVRKIVYFTILLTFLF